MRQSGRHLTERRQTVALFHALVDLRILEGDADGRRDTSEELDFFRRIRFPQTLVAQYEHTEELLFAQNGEHHRAMDQLKRALNQQHGLAFFALPVAQRQKLALQALDGNHAGSAQTLDKAAVSDGIDATFGTRADVADQVVRGSIRIHDVHRCVRHSTGVFERGQNPRHEVAHVDNVHQVGAQAFDATEELVLLLEHPAIDDALEQRTQRLEHDDDRGGGDESVEEEKTNFV